MEPEICMKMLRYLSEKCRAKFLVTTLSYSIVKIACLNDAFSEIFELEASPIEVQLLPQKDKRRKKRKGEKKKLKTPKAYFLVKKLQILISVHASSKNVVNCRLVERKAYYHVADFFLSRLELIWLIFRLNISQMSKKWAFCKKLWESMG